LFRQRRGLRRGRARRLVPMPMPVEGQAQIKWPDAHPEGRARNRLSGHRNDRGYRNDGAKLLHDQAPRKKRLDLAGVI